VIFLWGPPTDPPSAAIRAALVRQRAPVFAVDQNDVVNIDVEVSVSSAVSGSVQVGRRQVALETVRAAYIRPFDARQLPRIKAAGQDHPTFRHAGAVHEALVAWADLTPAIVINRPADLYGCRSKPKQLALIRAFGFETPATLVTTDPEAATAFWTKQKKVVYKSMSQFQSVVASLTPAHRKRFSNLRYCPTQFQEYIPGPDFRVHVIGDEIFAAEIESTAEDYRDADRRGLPVRIRCAHVPTDLSDRCSRLTSAMGLLISGIDFRRAPDGRWFCFEINPSPDFSYFQRATGQPLAQAITRILLARRSAHFPRHVPGRAPRILKNSI
jgi:hypothetical protein